MVLVCNTMINEDIQYNFMMCVKSALALLVDETISAVACNNIFIKHKIIETP